MNNINNIQRRNFLKLISASTTTLALAGCTAKPGISHSAQKQDHPNLRFNQNGKFKIVQFTDTHWLDGTEDDLKTAQLMRQITEFEKPDLIVLTGDVISGKEADSAHSQKTILTELSSYKTPWALVFGNHDDEGSCTRQQLWDITTSFPYTCCPKHTPAISGTSNYVLNIRSADNTRSCYNLFMIDSNAYSIETDYEDYGWIMPDQIEWFRQCSARYLGPDNNQLPALAFFHIPIPEYDELVKRKTYHGEFNEDVCCPKLNSGFFAAALQANNVRGMFVGHDHVNDYQGTLADVMLCYGRKTGFRSYSKDGFAKGARVIELTQDTSHFNTWLTLENSKRISYPQSQPEPA